MITYYKNQLDLAMSLKGCVDNYWALKIDEVDFISFIGQVNENNKDLLFNVDGNYTTVVKQRLGIKRLRLIDKVLGRVQ